MRHENAATYLCQRMGRFRGDGGRGETQYRQSYKINTHTEYEYHTAFKDAYHTSRNSTHHTNHTDTIRIRAPHTINNIPRKPKAQTPLSQTTEWTLLRGRQPVYINPKVLYGIPLDRQRIQYTQQYYGNCCIDTTRITL